MAVKKRSARKREEMQEHAQANPFFPHAFKTKIKFSGRPSILISQEAYNDMFTLVDEMDEEIGWLGSVEREGEDTFIIKKIYLVKQEVSGAETKMSPKGVTELISEVMKKDGMEEANKIRFWGHSHVEMDVGPSYQDEDQIAFFKRGRSEWFIRGIGNKNGNLSFTIFLFDKNIEVHDVPWAMLMEADDSSRERWKKEIKEKVKKSSRYSAAAYYDDRDYSDANVRRGSLVSRVIGQQQDDEFDTGRYGGGVRDEELIDVERRAGDGIDG